MRTVLCKTSIKAKRRCAAPSYQVLCGSALKMYMYEPCCCTGPKTKGRAQRIAAARYSMAALQQLQPRLSLHTQRRERGGAAANLLEASALLRCTQTIDATSAQPARTPSPLGRPPLTHWKERAQRACRHAGACVPSKGCCRRHAGDGNRRSTCRSASLHRGQPCWQSNEQRTCTFSSASSAAAPTRGPSQAPAGTCAGCAARRPVPAFAARVQRKGKHEHHACRPRVLAHRFRPQCSHTGCLLGATERAQSGAHPMQLPQSVHHMPPACQTDDDE